MLLADFHKPGPGRALTFERHAWGSGQVPAHARLDGANAEGRPGSAPSTQRNLRASLSAGRRECRRPVPRRAPESGSQVAPHIEPNRTIALQATLGGAFFLRASRADSRSRSKGCLNSATRPAFVSVQFEITNPRSLRCSVPGFPSNRCHAFCDSSRSLLPCSV